jgi:hypothetical protein
MSDLYKNRKFNMLGDVGGVVIVRIGVFGV